jgi:hypothetical protein
MKSKMIARRHQKSATVQMSTQRIQEAIQQASEIESELNGLNPIEFKDELIKLEAADKFLSSVIHKDPSTVEDISDDAQSSELSDKLTRCVMYVNRLYSEVMDGHEEQRDATQFTPAPMMASGSDNWEMNNKVTDSKKAEVPRVAAKKKAAWIPCTKCNNGMADGRTCQACNGSGHINSDSLNSRGDNNIAQTNRDQNNKFVQGSKKKADGAVAAKPVPVPVTPVPEATAPAPVTPTPAPVPATGDITAEQVIAVIPTEMILKIVNDLPKRDDFEQSTDLKDALIYMTEVLKTRPMEPQPVEEAPKVASFFGGLQLVAAESAGGGSFTTDERKGLDIQEGSIPEVGEAHSKQDDNTGVTKPGTESIDKFATTTSGGGAWTTDQRKGLDLIEDGGRTPEIAQAHKEQDDNTGIKRPTTEPIGKFAADMTANKAVKLSEKVAESLKGLFLEAKALCETNDTRPVREAVDSIYKVYQLMGEATKVLNKQLMQEEAEKTAVEVKEKGKKSSVKTADSCPTCGNDPDENKSTTNINVPAGALGAGEGAGEGASAAGEGLAEGAAGLLALASKKVNKSSSLLYGLKLADFDEEESTYRDDVFSPDDRDDNIPHCDSCQMSNINGVNCHEFGCPNQKKTWVPNRGWVKYNKCGECGNEVEEGESCCGGDDDFFDQANESDEVQSEFGGEGENPWV